MICKKNVCASGYLIFIFTGDICEKEMYILNKKDMNYLYLYISILNV